MTTSNENYRIDISNLVDHRSIQIVLNRIAERLAILEKRVEDLENA